MDVIVTVCAAFGLIVSEVKTEIMRLRTRAMSDVTATFSARYRNKRTISYTSGGTSTTTPTCPSRLTGAPNAWCSFRKYSLELYDRPSAPLELKIRMLKADVLETML